MNRTKRVYRSMVADTINPDHFLKKVFKKKPGGTAIGNLIRLAANKATGGILGTGANRLPVNTPVKDDGKGPPPIDAFTVSSFTLSAVLSASLIALVFGKFVASV